LQAPALSPRRREALRFLIATLAVTALYLAVQHLQLVAVGSLARSGWFSGNPQVELADEARAIAARSAPAEAKLTPEHALAAWRLGYLLGYLSEWLGAYGAQPEATMLGLRARMEDNLARAQGFADRLGIGPVAPMPVRTARDFAQIRERMEADEWGLAGRVEAVTSPRIRHLFMLGLQVGITAASLDDAPEGPLPIPPSGLIGKHATLAGLPADRWSALTRLEDRGDAKAAAAAYRAQAERLDAAIAAR